MALHRHMMLNIEHTANNCLLGFGNENVCDYLEQTHLCTHPFEYTYFVKVTFERAMTTSDDYWLYELVVVSEGKLKLHSTTHHAIAIVTWRT